jgi:hypothetical protein
MTRDSVNTTVTRHNRRLYWLIAMTAAYPLGNMLAYNLAHYLAYKSLFYLIPVSFTAVPIIGAIFAVRGKLFRKPYYHFVITISVSLLYILTWVVGVYVFTVKVVPYVR